MLEQAIDFIIKDRLIDFFDIYPNTYVIYSNGSVYSLLTNKYLTSYLSNNGYVTINLKCIDGYIKPYLVHRLVAYAFCEGYSQTSNIVNHIDCNPQNPDMYNLEWVTQQQNIQHAINLGRFKVRGEDNVTSKLTSEQVHYICKGLENNIKYSDILINSGLKVNDNNLDLITKIRTKKLWVHISNMYDIPDSEYRSKQITYTEEDIYKICELIKSNKTTREIAEIMNIDISTKKDIDKFWHFIRRIKNGISYTNISSRVFNS